MYGYVYKVVVDNQSSSWHAHYYIGQKKAREVDPYYYGSGAKISSYIKKHGTYGLRREVLFFADSREELNRLEEEAVGDLWQTDPFCMNSKPGGGSTARYSHTPETCKRISETMKRKCIDPAERARLTEISRARGPHTEETKRKISESNKRAYQNPEVRKRVSVANKGRNPVAHLTEEQKAQRYARATATRLRNYYAGKTEGHRGLHWYNNGMVQTLAKECPEGFVAGKLRHRNKEEEDT